MPRERYIRASEIGEYLFCERAWWLHQVRGLEPQGRERRARGVELHNRHGRRVRASQAMIVAALLLIIVAALLIRFT